VGLNARETRTSRAIVAAFNPSPHGTCTTGIFALASCSASRPFGGSNVATTLWKRSETSLVASCASARVLPERPSESTTYKIVAVTSPSLRSGARAHGHAAHGPAFVQCRYHRGARLSALQVTEWVRRKIAPGRWRRDLVASCPANGVRARSSRRGV